MGTEEHAFYVTGRLADVMRNGGVPDGVVPLRETCVRCSHAVLVHIEMLHQFKLKFPQAKVICTHCASEEIQ